MNRIKITNRDIPQAAYVLVTQGGITSSPFNDAKLSLPNPYGYTGEPVVVDLKTLKSAIKAAGKGAAMSWHADGLSVGGVVVPRMIPAGEYITDTEKGEWVGGVTLPTSAFRAIAHAMAAQDVRYYLNGLCVKAVSDTQIDLVATDGHRLARHTIYAAHRLPVGTERILPREAVLALLKDKKSATVTLECYEKSAYLSVGDAIISCTPVDGNFPDYTRVIPNNHPSLVAVSRARLLAMCKAGLFGSNEKYHGVKLHITADTLRLTSSNGDGVTVDMSAPCTASAALEIGFNVVYLIDALETMTADAVTLRYADSKSIIRIDDGMTTHVIMPIRL